MEEYDLHLTSCVISLANVILTPTVFRKTLLKHLAGHAQACFCKLENGIVLLCEFSYIMGCSLYFSLSQNFVVVPYQMRRAELSWSRSFGGKRIVTVLTSGTWSRIAFFSLQKFTIHFLKVSLKQIENKKRISRDTLKGVRASILYCIVRCHCSAFWYLAL